MPKLVAPCLLLPLLQAASPAQQPAAQNVAWHKDNSPSLGSGNAFPWGSDGIRYQCIIPAATLGNRPAFVQDILVAGRGGDRDVLYGDIEIRMGLTTLAVPVADWNLNNPNPTLVYRGPLRIKMIDQTWNGIGLPNSYIYIAPNQENLCVEVIVWRVDQGGGTAPNFYYPLAGSSASPGGNVERAFLYQWTSNQTSPPNTGTGGNKLGLVLDNGNLVVVGNGCQSSANTQLAIVGSSGCPTIGMPYPVALRGAAPNSPAVLTVGNNERSFGVVPLPFDLTPLGASGCTIWNNHLFYFVAPVDNLGTAQATLPIPNDSSLFTARMVASWLNVDPQANSLALTTSGYARMILGR